MVILITKYFLLPTWQKTFLTICLSFFFINFVGNVGECSNDRVVSISEFAAPKIVSVIHPRATLISLEGEGHHPGPIKNLAEAWTHQNVEPYLSIKALKIYTNQALIDWSHSLCYKKGLIQYVANSEYAPILFPRDYMFKDYARKNVDIILSSRGL